MRAFLLSSAFLFYHFALSGQAADTTLSIERLTVTEARSLRSAAMSVSSLDSVQLGESAYGSFADLLARHSHIYIKSAGPGASASVSFRGTAASHTQVLWNGININNPMAGDVDFSQLPVWFADNVTIYRGGSSLALGSGALGGAVSIASVPDWEKPYEASLVQSAGSYGTYHAFVSGGGSNGTIQTRVKYFFGRADNAFRYYNYAVDPSAYEKQKNAGYVKHGGTVDLFWKPGPKEVLALNLWFHRNDVGLPSNMAYSGIRQRQNRADNELRSVIRWSRYGQRFKSELAAGITAGTLDYLWERGTTLAESSFSRNSGLHFTYRFEYRFSEKTLLDADLRLSRYNASIKNRKYDDRTSYGRTEAEAGLRINHRFSNYWSGYVLVRELVAEGNFSRPMPSTGIEWLPLGSQKLRLAVNGSRNYHLPTLNDLYWKPGGNPDLRPEKGYTGDLALNFSDSRGITSYGISLTGYASWIDDWIVWRFNNRETYYASPENIRKVFSRGAEAEITGEISSGGSHIRVTANYTFTKATNERPESVYDKSKGRQLVYIPEHSGNLMLDAGYKRYYLFWTWSVVGERYTTSSNEVIRNRLPAYDLHDLTLGRKITLGKATMDLQFRINNIFGRRYTVLEYRPMPLQNYYFILKISL